MEFDKSRVYTALNADDVKLGSKVMLADTVKRLKDKVDCNDTTVLAVIDDEDSLYRFADIEGDYYAFCYLVSEPKEPRRMTNRELAKWLSQGNGQWMGSTNTVSITYSYGIFDDREVPASIMIRGWDEAEWHDALIKED